MAQKSQGIQQGARKKLSSNPREKKTVNEQLKEFEEGDKAKIMINSQEPEGRIPHRFHGRTVDVKGERGDAYKVEVEDGGETKTFFLKPVHLEEA